MNVSHKSGYLLIVLTFLLSVLAAAFLVFEQEITFIDALPALPPFAPRS